MLQEDVQLVKKIGLDSFRFSISWSRLFPSKTLTLDQSQCSKFIGYWCDLSWVPWHRQWSQLRKNLVHICHIANGTYDLSWILIISMVEFHALNSVALRFDFLVFVHELVNELDHKGASSMLGCGWIPCSQCLFFFVFNFVAY